MGQVASHTALLILLAVMNAFAGFVGLIGSGKETLFSVEGGNHQASAPPLSPELPERPSLRKCFNLQVVERLLRGANATLHLHTEVTGLSSVGHDETEYTIKYAKGDKQYEESFDAVTNLPTLKSRSSWAHFVSATRLSLPRHWS